MLILLIAFVVRLTFNIILQGIASPPKLDAGVDQLWYDTTAQNLATGRGFTFEGEPSTYTPGPTFLLAAIYYVMGVNYVWARIVWSLLGALAVIPVYIVGRELQSEGLGLSASFVLAVYPTHAYYSSHLLSEAPFSLFLMMAIAGAILMQKRRAAKYAVLLGVAVATAAFMKPAAIAYPGIYAVVLSGYARPSATRRWGTLLAIAAIACGLCIAPWTIRNYIATGHLVLLTTHGGTTFLDGNNETAFADRRLIGGFVGAGERADEHYVRAIKNRYERDKAAYAVAFATLKRHVGEIPKLEVMKLYRAFTIFYGTGNRMFNVVGGATWAVLMPFALIGFIVAIRNELYAPLLAGLVLLLVVTLVWFGDHRYRESMGPVFIIYGCRGCFDAVKWIQYRA